ncbi:MAG TPA: hypothetical protein VH109_11560 [Steroidobacteraceae bacterium]|jgi:hypothetical protein|nr:hypothetical protein [Steroidobacteraceae bacterium]
MKPATAHELAPVLLLVGLTGLVLSVILLALDWAGFEDRSNPETLALCVSLGALVAGGWFGRDPRAAAQHVLAGLMLSGAFLALACVVARYRTPHFFPTRSRTLLEVSVAGCLVSAVLLYLIARGSRGAR